MAVRIYTVDWHLSGDPWVARVSAIATDRTMSEKDLKAEIANRRGLADPEAVVIDSVEVT